MSENFSPVGWGLTLIVLMMVFLIIGLKPFLDDGFDEFELGTSALAGIAISPFVCLIPSAVLFLLVYAESSNDFSKIIGASIAFLFIIFLCFVIGCVVLYRAKTDIEPFDVFQLPENDFEIGFLSTVIGAFIACCEGNELEPLSCGEVPLAPCFEDEQRVLDIIDKIGNSDSEVCNGLAATDNGTISFCNDFKAFAAEAEKKFTDIALFAGKSIVGVSAIILAMALFPLLIYGGFLLIDHIVERYRKDRKSKEIDVMI